MKFTIKITLLLMFLPITQIYAQDQWDDSTGHCETCIETSFFIMGEYFGAYNDDQTDRVGAEVRGLGGTTYMISFLDGGLKGPADWPMGGWDFESVSARREFNFNEGSGTIDITINEWSGILTAEGNPRTNTVKTITGSKFGRPFTLQRVRRSSPTVGWPPPPQGATVLFDGTESSFTENWNPFSGYYDSDRQAMYRGERSKYQHGSVFLHVEFIQPYRPGAGATQLRSNSGVYLQDRYEMQITDTFGEYGIASNESGAVYGFTAPLVNATLPVLTWVAYDIYYKKAVFSGGTKTQDALFNTWFNGIQVQRDGPAYGKGAAATCDEGNTNCPLMLQDHSNHVYFRNVWIIEDEANYPDTNMLGRCPDGVSKWTRNGDCAPTAGCTAEAACNYLVGATVDDGNCMYTRVGTGQCDCPTPDGCSVGILVTGQNSYGIRLNSKMVSIELDGKHTIQMVDVNGKTVYSQVGNGARNYNLPELSPGLYFIKIFTAEVSYDERIFYY